MSFEDAPSGYGTGRGVSVVIVGRMPSPCPASRPRGCWRTVGTR